jgi:RNA polymerase sigma factor (sigma-70 family)
MGHQKGSWTLLMVMQSETPESTDDYEFLVRSLARRYARRQGDIQDFEQEARLAVFLGLKDWKPDAKKMCLRNYLGFRIRHALKEFTRTHYRPGFVSLDEEITGADSENSFSRYNEFGVQPEQEACVEADRVSNEIGALTEIERRVILLVAEGFSLHEIADIRGRDFRAVHKAKERALKKLTVGREAA